MTTWEPRLLRRVLCSSRLLTLTKHFMLNRSWTSWLHDCVFNHRTHSHRRTLFVIRLSGVTQLRMSHFSFKTSTVSLIASQMLTVALRHSGLAPVATFFLEHGAGIKFRMSLHSHETIQFQFDEYISCRHIVFNLFIGQKLIANYCKVCFSVSFYFLFFLFFSFFKTFFQDCMNVLLLLFVPAVQVGHNLIFLNYIFFLSLYNLHIPN